MPRVERRSVVGPLVVALLLIGLVVAYVALSVYATYTVKTDFFGTLGMRDAYRTRWFATLLLWIAGAVLAALVALPVASIVRAAAGGAAAAPASGERPPPPGPHPGEDASESDVASWSARRDAWMAWELSSRRAARARGGGLVPRGLATAVWLAGTFLLTLAVGGRLALERDLLLAARAPVRFGVADPIFGVDVSRFVFTFPAIQTIASAILTACLLALIGTAVTGVGLSRALTAQDNPVRAAHVAGRATRVGLVYGGLLLGLAGLYVWFSRYGLVLGDGDRIAGAGKAVRTVDIPARTVAAVAIALLGLGLITLAIPALRRASEVPLRRAALAIGGAWVLAAVVLAVLGTPLLILLAVPAVLVTLGVMRVVQDDDDLRDETMVPGAWALSAVVTTIFLALVGPIGARIYDATWLRGSTLQVERSYIGYTLESTRRASALDQAEVVNADYQQNGVTQQAITDAPASVGSLRFLDAQPTQEACLRQQTFDQFYTCDEVDVDRYTLAGKRVTVFSIGREIDYTRAPDFQRRHFTYTHGYGLVLAPVNKIDPVGRPSWIAGNIPQTGLEPELTHPEIYFGAQPGIPWSIVNTDQPVFNGPDKNEKVTWEGTTGVRVGSGLHRLAVAKFLGGLPYVGGGRRVWNATGGSPAGPDSKLLLYRDIAARVRELAPFLDIDGDPYFAAAGGRLYVLLNTYVATSRYPYSARFGQSTGAGINYLRNAAIAVVDAYSGDTRLYVVDDREPLTATWRRVYPSLFRPLDQMPADLRAHIRYGERLFNYQSAVAELFHVSNVDVFYNKNEAWAPTKELTGQGVSGESKDSPARYTYAVLPGQTEERFIVMRSYKPATKSRGIGFSGWFAVDNEPDAYGRATILRFPTNAAKPLDSLDVFTANVGRDPDLSQQITTRGNSVVRGNTIVVPIGQGLLYAQPLYLDTAAGAGDSLPTLWKVIVSFGDGKVYSGGSFEEALRTALRAAGRPGGTSTTPTDDASLEELIQTAAEQWDAYRRAFGAGDDEAAAAALARFQAALEQARAKAGGAP